MNKYVGKVVGLKPINELNDMGDRMILGYPMAQGGAIGAAASDFTSFYSKDVAQDPKKFGTFIDKTNLIEPDRGENVINVTPLSQTDKEFQKYKKDVDVIKTKVTPDEIICGIEYELSKMVMKDTNLAKQLVVKNLRIDPQFYSKLHMLGVYPGEKEDIPSDINKQVDTTIGLRPVPTLWEIVQYFKKNGRK